MKPLEYIKEKVWLQALLLTILLFAGSYLTIGWWTDNYQHFYDSVASGELTDYYLPAAYDPFPEYMRGSAYLFNWLGLIYPIHWIAFFLNSLLFISIWILFFQVIKHTKEMPLLSRILLLLFLSVLFFESVVLYHMVRITMFAGIAALSGLIVADEKNYLNKKMIPFFLLFIIALWIRCNVHLFVLIFVSAAFFLHGKSLKPLLPFYLAFILFFLYYCNVVFWTNYDHDLNYYFLYNTEFKLQFVGAYKPDLNLGNHLDSLKYMAVKNNIIADEINLTPEFYKRIGIFTNLSKFSTSQLYYAVYVFGGAMLENIHFIVADIILILFYVFLGGAELKHYKFKTFLLFLFFYSVLFAICFIKMENRFLVPFQVLFLYTIIVLHKPNLFYRKANIIYLIVFLLLIIPLSGYYIWQKIEFSKKETQEFKNSFDLLSKHYGDAVLVINDGFVTKNRPYETFYQKKHFKNFYFFNYYASHLSSWYRPYLEKECNCNPGNIYSFYDFLLKKDCKVLLLDEEKRMDVLKKYLSEVSGKNYEIDSAPIINKADSLQLKLRGFTGELTLYEMK